ERLLRQRSDVRHVPILARRGRAHPVRADRRGECDCADSDLARGAGSGGREQGSMSGASLRRHLTSRVMTVLIVVLSFTAVLALVLILGNLLVKGASSLDWAFFTKSPVPAGQSGGGVANAIAGTILIVGLAALIGVPVGVGAGMYLAASGGGRLGFAVRFVADVLNGTPSIVIGIVGRTFIVNPSGGRAALLRIIR